MNVNRRAFLTGAAASAVAAAATGAYLSYLQETIMQFSEGFGPTQYVTHYSPDTIDPIRYMFAREFQIPERVLFGDVFVEYITDKERQELLAYRQYYYGTVTGIDIGTGDFSTEWSNPAKTKQLGTQEHVP